MVSNIGIKVLSSLSIIILACFTMKNKRFENKSESFYQIKSDTVSVEDSIKRAQWDEEERKYLDSACQSETEKANLDIKKNKLVYFHYFGMVEQYNGDAEMTELLKKYNIEVDLAFTSCTVPYHLQNCYAQIMRKEIDRKFGPNFIDSLREVSKLEYVKKNPNKIYRFEECDWVSRYPGDKEYNDFFKNSQDHFWRNTKYPSGFEFRKDKDLYSYMGANFILYKTGKISDIKVDISFQNKKNYQYSSYFINQLKKFVQNTKWIPATSAGIKVNSEMDLTIHFK